jgi:phage/conjugal plasmid C-4 type zinc finger TraR family protein
MDDCDIANEIAERYLIGNISAARAGFQGDLAIARGECLDCGEEIPEARRAAVPGCLRCITCQTIWERGV